MLIVLSAPSGAGKDSVRDLLMEWGLPVYFAVTANTRPRRPEEIDGLHYRFMTLDDFERLEREGGFIESAHVYGQRKGVPRDEVERPMAAGRDVLARVDIQGAETLKRLFPDAVLIFLAPPSLEEAQRRLGSRDTESDEQLRIRLAMAPEEMAAASRFDHVVVNSTGELEPAVREIWRIIAGEKARRASTQASA